jgi:uncharacterized protein (TIGR03083 family)
MTMGSAWGEEPGALDTSRLFRPLLGELIGLLRGLTPVDWDRPTVAGAWKVRDVAAHLLDGDLRKIAVYRDSHFLRMDGPIESDRDLARFVNSLNSGGVAWAARLSPKLLVDLLEIVGKWGADVVEALPPTGRAIFPVSWAGEAESTNWMDTGREYAEKWHHQMQIRDALGASRLLTPLWMEPVLDISVRAFPVAFARTPAPPGTAVTFEVHGPTSGAWSVVRGETNWRLVRGRPAAPEALVRASTDDSWRLLYNAVQTPGLMDRIEVTGQAALTGALLAARSVIL